MLIRRQVSGRSFSHNMTDLLITQPKHIDYPLFRAWLGRYHSCFENIYVALLDGNPDRNLSQALTKEMPYVQMIYPPIVKSDWRDNALHELLIQSKRKRVLFLEQDFLMRDDAIVKYVINSNEPFIGHKEGDRVHPCFAYVTRDLINQTSGDFSARPPQYDHFGLFFHELKKLTPMLFLEDLGFTEKQDFYHMAGFTNNYHCYKLGQPFYKPEEFLTYNHYALSVAVDIPFEFEQYMQEIDGKYYRSELDVPFIKKFFY